MDRLVRQLPFPQVMQSRFSLLRPELKIEILCRLLIDGKQPASFTLLSFRLLRFVRLRQTDARSVRQRLHGLRKCVVFIFHQKGKHIPARSAAEAVVHLLGTGNGKGRRFFIMKWAKPEVIGPLLLQVDITGNHVHNIISRPDLFDQLVRIKHRPRTSFTLKRHRPFTYSASIWEYRSPHTGRWQTGRSSLRYNRRPPVPWALPAP